MSENMPANVQLDNGNGSITFAADVVATIAGLAANEVEGVASMGTPASGFADILSRKQSSKSLTRGVRVEIIEGKVSVHLTIVVDYGFPVPEVAGNIQENVKKAIETMSGLSVSHVDVYIQGVSFEREKNNTVALEMQNRPMLQKEEGAQDGAPAQAEAQPEQGEAGGEDGEFDMEMTDEFGDEETLDEERALDEAPGGEPAAEDEQP